MKENNEKFTVIDRNGKYTVTGFGGLSIRCDNRFDAVQLCQFLNGQDKLINDYRDRYIEYYTALKSIQFVVDSIHRETGELHIVEKCIRIKDLLKEVL